MSYWVVDARFYFFVQKTAENWQPGKNCLEIKTFKEAKQLLDTKVGEIRMFAAIFYPGRFFHYDAENIYKEYIIEKSELVYSKPIKKMEQSDDEFWYVITDDNTFRAFEK